MRMTEWPRTAPTDPLLYVSHLPFTQHEGLFQALPLPEGSQIMCLDAPTICEIPPSTTVFKPKVQNTAIVHDTHCALVSQLPFLMPAGQELEVGRAG